MGEFVVAEEKGREGDVEMGPSLLNSKEKEARNKSAIESGGVQNWLAVQLVPLVTACPVKARVLVVKRL